MPLRLRPGGGSLLQQYAGTHYQHDVCGNRIRETAPSGHTTEYTYDAEDRLIAAKRYRRAPAVGDNAIPEMQAKYGYDGFGRRLYKLVKQAKRPAQLTVFTWDGDLLTSEETFEGEYSFLERWAYPEAPALEREVPDERYSLPIAQRVHSIITQPQQRTHWLYEPESFIPAAQLVETYQDTQLLRTGTEAASLTTAGATTSEPRLYLIHTDHLGTPQELTDGEGQLYWAGQYRAWGELQKAMDGQSNAAAIDMRLRFQGQYHDEETGLHYNRFRYYDPRVGRFTTQDPISLAGGINLYQYAPNPVGWVDPYGLTKELVTYWPPNNGAVGKEKNITLPTGSIIDRYGYSGGTYTSPVNTPFAMRALPSDTINKPYSVYRVEKPIHNVAESRIAPWFGQLGGGMQYRLPKSVQEHIGFGHLKEIGKTSCGHKSSRK